MSTTIDTLVVDIQSSSTQAVASVTALATALEKIKKSTVSSTAVKNLNDLTTALRNLTPVSSNASKLSAMADALSKLSSVGSLRGVINQLNSLAPAMRSLSQINMDGVDEKIAGLARSVAPLSDVSAGGIGTIASALAKLQNIDLDKIKFDEEKVANFAAEIKKLDDAIGPLSTKLVTIGSAFKAVNSGAISAGGSVKKLGTKVNATTLNLASMITVINGVKAALMPIVRLLSDSISAALEWDGIANRFGRGFGNQAKDVYSWVQRLNKELGINTQQFMQYSSVYATMLQGFGVGLEDSSEMALGYTELTYDIWAGYNDIYKSYADAADAVKSAIAGEVEPIRRAGFTIVESTLEQTAANHGLDISLEKATEAQKSYLRYLTLVDQAHAQSLVGTYAREMNTAEGVVRTFRQQLTSLAQTFGSLFLPILVKVMPWLQAFIELLTEAIHRVAAFFGITIQDISGTWDSGVSSGLGGIADSADDATGSLGDTAGAVKDTTDALKDLKKATIGIDELNVISPPNEKSSGSGGSGSGAGGGLGAFEGLDVGSLWDESIFDSIQFQVDNIKGKLEEALSMITAVISGFMLAIGTILVVSGANIPLGLGLMAVGAVGLVATIAENWNGMSEQLAKTLTTVTSVLGGFLLAIGAFLAFSGVNVGLGAALMVAGAVSLGTAMTINWKFLEGDLKNTLSILTGVVAGGLLAMGALFAFTGVDVPLGIALMAAGAVGLATAVGLNWDAMSTPLRQTIGTLEAIVGSALLTLGAILAFSGVNIPLGIGLMAAGAVSLVSATALNWDSLTGDVKSTISTITTLVSGSLIGVGAVLAFSGVAIPMGIAMIAAGSVGIIATVAANWNAVPEAVKSVLKELGAVIGISLLAVGAVLAFSGVALPLGISLMAAGAVSLVSAIALNWDSVTTSVKNVLTKIGIAAGGAMLALGLILCLSGVGIPLGIALMAAGGASLVSGIALNWDSLVGKLKETWGKIEGWWNGIKKLDPVNIAVGLIKKGWSTVKGWIGSIPGVSQAVGLVKKGWSSVKNWVGSIPAVSQAVSLAKKGWSSVKKWVGTVPTLSAGIKLVKSGWSSVKKWLGDLNFNLGFKLPKIKVKWSTKEVLGFKISYPSGFETYAKGGFPDMGEMFIAREAGPEMVGRIGNRTTVANNDQIVEGISEGVYAAVIAANKESESGGNRTINVVLPDGRVLASCVEKSQRERGASIMGNQVYAY